MRMPPSCPVQAESYSGIFAFCPGGQSVGSELTLHPLRPPRTQVPFSVPLPPFPLLPVPDNVTSCGLPGPLSVSESVPVKTPVAPGENVMLIEQFAPDARVEPHVFVSAKLTLAAIFTMFSVPVPELFSKIVCAGLVVPTTSSLKAKAVTDKLAWGDTTPSDPPPQPLLRSQMQSVSQRYFVTMPPMCDGI